MTAAAAYSGRKLLFLLAAGLAVAAVGFFRYLPEPRVLRVLGQPTFTGQLQMEFEEPFFRSLAKSAGLSVNVRYIPQDKDLSREESGLEALRGGLFDVVSLRFAQLGGIEPRISGIDLPGVASDFKAARASALHYLPVIDRALQDRWDSRLLATFPFGPQVIVCTRPIRGLADLKSLRVRVAGPLVQKLVDSLGGLPLTLSLADTRQALRVAALDCATSSLASAKAAGWFEPGAKRYVLLLPLQFGINGYAVSNTFWNGLNDAQQRALARAIGELSDQMWTAAEKLHADILQCATSERPCIDREMMTIVPAEAQDMQWLKAYALGQGLDNWLAYTPCRDCRADWTATIGRLLGPSTAAAGRSPARPTR